MTLWLSPSLGRARLFSLRSYGVYMRFAPADIEVLGPAIASAAMTFSSVSVIGNALRLRRQDL